MAVLGMPATQSAEVDNLSIAYQVCGSGPVDLVIHLREVEVRGARIGGIAVHVAARIVAAAGADEVLVSRTIKDVDWSEPC